MEVRGYPNIRSTTHLAVSMANACKGKWNTGGQWRIREGGEGETGGRSVLFFQFTRIADVREEQVPKIESRSHKLGGTMRG